MIVVIAAARSTLLSAKEAIKEILEWIVAAVIALAAIGCAAAAPHLRRGFRAYVHYRRFNSVRHLAKRVTELLRGLHRRQQGTVRSGIASHSAAAQNGADKDANRQRQQDHQCGERPLRAHA